MNKICMVVLLVCIICAFCGCEEHYEKKREEVAAAHNNDAQTVILPNGDMIALMDTRTSIEEKIGTSEIKNEFVKNSWVYDGIEVSYFSIGDEEYASAIYIEKPKCITYSGVEIGDHHEVISDLPVLHSYSDYNTIEKRDKTHVLTAIDLNGSPLTQEEIDNRKGEVLIYISYSYSDETIVDISISRQIND